MPTKVHLFKAMAFLVVMYGCENWTIKKAECRRIDAFKLWCWRRFLRVPWTARRLLRSKEILKEISPEYSLKGLMLMLKLQYFGHLIWRADSFLKTLMQEKIEGRRRRGRQRMRWLDGITDNGHGFEWTLGVVDEQGGLTCCGSWANKESYMTERLNWTETCYMDPGCLKNQGRDMWFYNSASKNKRKCVVASSCPPHWSCFFRWKKKKSH